MIHNYGYGKNPHAGGTNWSLFTQPGKPTEFPRSIHLHHPSDGR